MRQIKIRKEAFTLAEVLITIGIIGVVAAITIPNLISNYQKRTWTAQLQKSYAVLNQGFRRMLADDNASLLSQTESFASIGGDEINSSNGIKYKRCSAYYNDFNSENCKDFYSNLSKYFKIADIRNVNYKSSYLNSKTRLNQDYPYTAITLMDGAMIFGHWFYSQPSGSTNNQMKGYVALFNLDVNGSKGPNIMGRDLFVFYLGDNGIVYPYGSMAYSEYVCGNTNCYWNSLGESQNAIWEYSCLNPSDSSGKACTARVLEEGKMNY